MKIGEALNQRASLTQRIAEIRARLAEIAVTVEGDEPQETVEDLLAEHDKTVIQLKHLVISINRRNMSAVLNQAAGLTVMEALAEREMLRQQLNTFTGLIKASDTRRLFSYRQSGDLKYVRNTNIKTLRDGHKDIARQLRELDAKIQQINWTVDL